MVSAKTPTIANIKNNVSLADARALLSIAVCEVCDFFNVGKNMNDVQIAMTVDIIIERFWHLKLEEIKYCFRRAMENERLFDRLDGNIIIGWLREYDAERTETAMRLSDEEAARCVENAAADAVSFDEYVKSLRQRAKTDPDAAKILTYIDSMAESDTHLLSREEKAAKDHEFKIWRMFNYFRGKKS